MSGTHKKSVIYTCITGAYDGLIEHSYVDPQWDYVCFTDTPSILDKKDTKWKIKPIAFNKLDNIRNQRWHKLHPHILFSDYKESIWIDANINILSDKLFADIEVHKNNLMAVAIHPDRKCVYDELTACLELAKDQAEIMTRQIELIKQDGFPEQYGLFDTSITYRKHLDPKIIKVMDDWWWWIENYSRRDQLSLTYVLWKNQLPVPPISSHTYRNGKDVAYFFKSSHVTKEELIKQKNLLLEELSKKENLIAELQHTIDKQNIIINSWKQWLYHPIRRIINSIKAKS